MVVFPETNQGRHHYPWLHSWLRQVPTCCIAMLSVNDQDAACQVLFHLSCLFALLTVDTCMSYHTVTQWYNRLCCRAEHCVCIAWMCLQSDAVSGSCYHAEPVLLWPRLRAWTAMLNELWSQEDLTSMGLERLEQQVSGALIMVHK